MNILKLEPFFSKKNMGFTKVRKNFEFSFCTTRILYPNPNPNPNPNSNPNSKDKNVLNNKKKQH
jgi:hypothetical protein